MPDKITEGYQLSPQQRRLWLLREHDRVNGARRARVVLRLSGRLDLTALRQAIELLVARHEALRTSFVMAPGMRLPLQVVSPKASVRWVEERGLDHNNSSDLEPLGALDAGLTVSVTCLDEQMHELELTMSRLCVDVASLQNIAQELGRCYEAVTSGVVPNDEPMQYPDYADWQNELLATDDDEARDGKAYWRRQAVSAADVLNLPYEVPGEPRSELVLESVLCRIDWNTARQVVSEASRLSCSVEGYLLGCWIVLLSKLAHNVEIVIAERVSGRKYDELESSIGLFEKWLPVRTFIDDRAYFPELLQQIESVRSKVREWQDYYPCASADGEVTGWPVIGFAFGNDRVASNGDFALTAPVGFVLERTEPGVSGFKLLLSCYQRQDSLEIELQYHPSAFRRPDAERIAGQFMAVIQSTVNNPAVRVCELSPLFENEREELLYKFNRTAAPFPSEKTVHRLIEEQSARTPHCIAIIGGETQLTYAELNSEANKLARMLRRKGVREGACVGLVMERSAETLVGMLGILKAGGAYVPLDVNAPRERLLTQLDEIDSPVLVTHEDLLQRLPDTGLEAVCLGRNRLPHGEEAPDLLLPCDPESLAYVIYTSGSTGVPKGVGVTHRNLVNYAHFICREFQFCETAQHSFAMVSAITADLCNTVVFPSLISGGCLHMLSDDVATDPSLFAGYMARHQVDVLKIVPSHMNALLDSPVGARMLPRRQLFLGGEALMSGLLARLRGMAPTCEVINHYGPTEATVGALLNRVTAEKDGPSSVPAESEALPVTTSIPIGRPMANVETYVLDANLQPVPIGVVGELYLGGEGLARGYLQQPAQTAERFVPHPFAPRPGVRLYRTGDLVRLLSCGMIEFIGRADDQAKIKGYRVELGEVKAALLLHPSVRDAVAILRDDAAGLRQLVAYVVAASGAIPTSADLRMHMTERVLDYMLPSAYVFIDRLPLTRNGKVDRAALPAPTNAGRATRKLAPPRTDTEQTLAAIWKDVLRVKEIGINDNFFELGGDSIVSIQIVARARQAGLRLQPKQIFSSQTIAELASVAVSEVVQAFEPAQGPVSGPAPLTPIQHWFFAQPLSDHNHFNLALLFAAPPDVEGRHLRAALAHVVNHHDALRLRFRRTDNGWLQQHAELDTEVPFAEVNLSNLGEDGRNAAIGAECERWQHTFNLADGPLVRMVFVKLGENVDSRLLIVVHHLVVDVVSWRILLDDLLLAYEQARAGKAIKLPPKTLSFKQWAEQLTEFARSEQLAEEIPYWRAMLSRGADRLPANGSSRDSSTAIQTLTTTLSSEATTALLRDAPRAYRTEITDLLLTALVRAVWSWNGQSKLLVEMEGHGREEFQTGLDVTRTVGWFTTHYPVLLEVEEEEDSAVTLKRVKELLRGVPRRGLGFGLLRWIRGDQRLAGELKANSHADIKFNYLGQLDGAISPGSQFQVAPESSGGTRDGGGSGHLLDVNAAVLDGGLHLRWMFDPQKSDSARMQKLMELYTTQLLGLIRHCSAATTRSFTPSDLPAANLNQQELDSFISAISREDAIPINNIEDIYSLSPMQEGLLFHSRSTPESDVYFRQLSCAIQGELNVTALSLAWQTVVDHHPALRTSFHWAGIKSPLQVVSRRVELPVTQIDWHGLAYEEQAARLQALIRDERRRGFDLSQAPLMRLVLLRLGDAAYHIVWSYHHLLLDGWAKHSVFDQILKCYQAACRGEELNVKSSRPYVDYIKWLQRQDMKKAEAYWRRTLEGFDRPTAVGGEAATGSVAEQAFYDRRRTLLSREATSALQHLARGNQLTLNTVVQAAWAIFLSRTSRQHDVVFGAVVSGRPPSLEGSERMIGLFVNTLPVRIEALPNSEVLNWCKQLQERQLEMQQYEYSPLVMVQNWSSIPRGETLLESLLVFENYPVDAVSASNEKASLVLSNFNIIEYSNFPLTLMVGPSEELSLLFLYDRQRFNEASIVRMLAKLTAILNLLAAAKPKTTLQEINAALDESDLKEQLLKQEELKELKLQKLKTVRRKMVHSVTAS